MAFTQVASLIYIEGSFELLTHPLNPNRSLGLAWILIFRRVDFGWLLMSNSKLLRIKNGQKTPYKKQKTASSHKKK